MRFVVIEFFIVCAVKIESVRVTKIPLGKEIPDESNLIFFNLYVSGWANSSCHGNTIANGKISQVFPSRKGSKGVIGGCCNFFSKTSSDGKNFFSSVFVNVLDFFCLKFLFIIKGKKRRKTFPLVVEICDFLERKKFSGFTVYNRSAPYETTVESISGKRFDKLEDLFSDLFSNTGGLTSGDELFSLFFNKFEDLLSHRLSQNVRFSERESRKRLGDLHDLFLVHSHTIGIPKDRLKLWMEILYLFCSVFSGDEIGDPVHWSRSVECHHCDDVFKDGGLEKFQVAFHTRGFQLKNSGSLSALEEGVCFFIIEGECLNIDTDIMDLFDDAQGILDDGEVFETQEVHLKKPDLFYIAGLG